VLNADVEPLHEYTYVFSKLNKLDDLEMEYVSARPKRLLANISKGVDAGNEPPTQGRIGPWLAGQFGRVARLLSDEAVNVEALFGRPNVARLLCLILTNALSLLGLHGPAASVPESTAPQQPKDGKLVEEEEEEEEGDGGRGGDLESALSLRLRDPGLPTEWLLECSACVDEFSRRVAPLLLTDFEAPAHAHTFPHAHGTADSKKAEVPLLETFRGVYSALLGSLVTYATQENKHLRACLDGALEHLQFQKDSAAFAAAAAKEGGGGEGGGGGGGGGDASGLPARGTRDRDQALALDDPGDALAGGDSDLQLLEIFADRVLVRFSIGNLGFPFSPFVLFASCLRSSAFHIR
jgi:hypothetical protein